ncbi:hypothetical protein [Methylophaga nitratireducenticrescens]|uniref:hypothetical protein n=1 Tax=Methylophaga nitratireducenticrescens TaxID=754476 RepID=UPI000CDBAF5E|nr:hypothetical protein [Methylophaga nitratireducenticrescens]AUZ83801.1 hypothetical protein CDW43_04090 [Methylophaga nitratireducenticrescens]
MKKLITVFVLLFSFNEIAIAEDGPELLFEGGINSLLATRDAFSITVSDQVTDGCLPNPGQLKDKMEIALRKNGFGIEKGTAFFTDKILITALGYKISDSACVIHLSVDLIFPTNISVPLAIIGPEGDSTFVPYTYQIGDNLLKSIRSSMQGHLNKQVTEYADKLYLDISRARDDIFTKFPSLKDSYEESKK